MLTMFAYASPVLMATLGIALFLAARADRIASDAPVARRDEDGAKTMGPAGRALARISALVGPSFSESELGILWATCTALPGLLGLVAGAGAASAALSLVGAAAVPLWAASTRRSRKRKFDDQLGEVMPLIASNMRAGSSIAQSITPVAETMDEPMRGEFTRLASDVKAGIPLPDALDSMARRNESKDLGLFAAAVRISQQRGGSLAEITERVGETIRARTELRRYIRAKTSLNRFEAYFLASMPALMLIVLVAISEPHRSFYTTTEGWIVLAICGLLDIIGLAIMFKMGDLDTD